MLPIIRLLFLTFLFVVPSSVPASADSVGMTLTRKQVLRSCLTERSDRCEYLIFFDFQRMSKPGAYASILPDHLNNLLPAQLTSRLAAPTNDQIEKCHLHELEDFVNDIVMISRQPGEEQTIIAEFSPSINFCFQRGKSSSTISLVVFRGTIPGFISCIPDYAGLALCEIMFTRRNSTVGSKGPAEERISIGSFRSSEVTEILSNFPKFPVGNGNGIDEDFMLALTWLDDMLETGVRTIESGE